MRRMYNPHRKRPHVLPPLSDSQLLRPMDPLQPPDLLLMENRLGSPAPKPNQRETDYDINGNDGKPIIKISEEEDNTEREISRESLRYDLLSDPLFSDGNDLFLKIQKRNSLRSSDLGERWRNRENYLINCSKNSVKNLQSDLNKKLRCSSVRPMGESESLKKCCPSFKIVQIPNRYAPLKPIGQGLIDENTSLNTQ